MKKVRLIHWHELEARQRASLLEALGFSVDWHLPQGAVFLKSLREDKPDAIVIDLGRLPAQGRDLGIAIRHQKATRHVPLVFVGGKTEKVDRVKSVLGDAVFTNWDDLGSDLAQAIEKPLVNPCAPDSIFDAYRERSLVAKLGIKPGLSVALIGEPEAFREILGELPEDVSLDGWLNGNFGLIIWFVQSLKELGNRIDDMATKTGKGAMWIAWPKKGSKIACDLTQTEVRRIGLAKGLVDYKICSFDKTWSGLLFTRRKPKR